MHLTLASSCIDRLSEGDSQLSLSYYNKLVADNMHALVTCYVLCKVMCYVYNFAIVVAELK